MKIAFYPADPSHPFNKAALSAGLEIVNLEEAPDVIISLGGDGTLLRSERDFPGVPKLPLRPLTNADRCPSHRHDIIFNHLSEGKITTETFCKLSFRGPKNKQRHLVLNEVSVHHAYSAQAIRFNLIIDGRKLSPSPCIGDGVLIAGVFGSTGYFRSISGTIFGSGLGVTLNNPTTPVWYRQTLCSTIILPAAGMVVLEINRGPATVDIDSARVGTIHPKDKITVSLSDETAKVLSLESFRCPECRFSHQELAKFCRLRDNRGDHG